MKKIEIEQENVRSLQAALKEAKSGKEGLLYDEHKGIYARYQDTESYLKTLGGKHITDEHGHGWWEVPVNPKRDTPTRMFSTGAGLGVLGSGTYGMLAPEAEE